MIEQPLSTGSMVIIPKPDLDLLMVDLRTYGYDTVGPKLYDDGIVYSRIEGLNDMPRGFSSKQQPASYRLIQTGKARYFDFIPGGQSWKQFLFPPFQTLFKAVKEDNWNIKENDEPSPRYALIGVRACELAAIQIQDKIFLREDFSDPIYRMRRENLFVLGVNCVDPNETCFCASMNTGPRHKTGFDLCLTELDDVFMVEVGSELGRSLLAARAYELPSAFIQSAANSVMELAAKSMVRTIDTRDLPGLLLRQLNSKRWTEVGQRCLSCTNCTSVCPTCFCWDVNDRVDIPGKTTERAKVWDSCFNPNYSYVVGGNTRPTIRARYRQWLTHKLGTWKDQFGMLGCVGCGRCITWCPAGIDLTEEIAALRAEE
jgi:sulfhydrogenase subunit beta (sulfur reductase)